jgi:adenosine kinase
MSRILVSGSVAYDRIMNFAGNFTDHIVPDKMHTLSVSFQVEKVIEHFGGCAGNIAYNLALLGEEPSIAASVGKDFDRYEEHLLNHKISVDSLVRDPSDFTSVAHIITDSANNQIAAFAMAAGAHPYGEFPGGEYEAAILGAGCVEDTLAFARQAKEAGIPYYFDPGQAMPAFSAEALKEIISGAAGLFGNDYEMGLIGEKTGWNEKEVLQETPLVVVTLGAKGSRILTADGEITIAAAPIRTVVDPTGAGDAHRAGFVKGLMAQLPLKSCGQLASTVAAYAIEQAGTQNHSFTLEELAGRYEAAYGEKLTL